MQKNWLNLWRSGALMLPVVVALLNLAHQVQSVPPPPIDVSAAKLDPVTQHERRLAALRESLRVRGVTGTIGYLADAPGAQLAQEPSAVEDYYLTQFALVPLVLAPGAASREWIVANLHATNAVARAPAGWRIVEDFGGGVTLLRKDAP